MSAVQNTEPGPADPRSSSPLESLLRNARQRWTPSSALSVLIVAGCSLFVLIVMNPALLLADNTPTGGDMGAHVWGPAYLRDELLPNFRLTGWSPDWYAGFPAYQFYMIVPALAIVALNAGINPWIGVPVSICLAALFTRLGRSFNIRPLYIVVASAVAATLLISLPYGIAFKIVTVLGLIFFPVSVWFMAKMAHAPEPLPAFMAMGGTVFLFDASFWILGGNIMSTLAGEFSFSISITLVFFAVGLVFRGMETGEWRARSAVVIALVALCHVIPLFFLVGLLAFVILLGRNLPRYPVVALVTVFAGLLFLTGPNTLSVRSMLSGFSNGSSAGAWSTVATLVAIAVSVVLLVLPFIKNRELVTRATWLVFAGGAAALVAMFWLLPFWYQGDHFNDMGWSRLIEIGPKVLTTPMKVCLPIAALGLVTSFLTRNRLGMLFSASAAVSLAAVANIPQGALWNERLLPFFFLSIYLLTSITIADWVRGLAMLQRRDFDRPSPWVSGIASIVGFAVLLVGISMPLRTLPFGEAQEDGSYTWGVFKSTERTKVPGWGRWNYAGYEGRKSYAEYHHVVTTMDQIGQTNGCGRAMWEFDDSLDRYGTPMALMLLPYWTDGCIGSMEGLFFESSATTPFHFLNQSVLSQEPSRAQRDLPYKDFDIDVGVAQLQTMGVKYYMALKDESIEAARGHDDLVELPDGDAAPFVVFEVQGAELVEGLEYDPVIVDENAGISTENDDPDTASEDAQEDRFETGWLSQAIEYYNDPNSFTALPAEDGPDSWRTVDSLATSVGSPQDPIEVTNIEMGQDNVSFSVDEVGSPVLVKVSHFPNWKVDGAEGPWRVGPNLMVVVPTEKTVKLSYGRHPIDWISMLLTLLGIAGVVGLYRHDRRRRLAPTPAKQDTTLTSDQAELWERLDQLDGPEPEDESDREAGSEPEVDIDIGEPVPVVSASASGTDPEVHTEEHCGEGWDQLQQLESEVGDGSTIETADDAAQPLAGSATGVDEPSTSSTEQSLTASTGDEPDDAIADESGLDERSTNELGSDEHSTDEPGSDEHGTDELGLDEHSTDGSAADADSTHEGKVGDPSTTPNGTEQDGSDINGTDEHCGEGWLQLGMLDNDNDAEEGDDNQSGSTGTEGVNIR